MHLELLAEWLQVLQLQRSQRSSGGAHVDAPEFGGSEALLGFRQLVWYKPRCHQDFNIQKFSGL